MEKRILILAVFLGVCINSMHAVTRRQAVLGSKVMPAGMPHQPQFTLTPTQTAQLPPIDPDVYQDSLLPAVRNNFFLQIRISFMILQ